VGQFPGRYEHKIIKKTLEKKDYRETALSKYNIPLIEALTWVECVHQYYKWYGLAISPFYSISQCGYYLPPCLLGEGGG
jgi:hypothetical protein